MTPISKQAFLGCYTTSRFWTTVGNFMTKRSSALDKNDPTIKAYSEDPVHVEQIHQKQADSMKSRSYPVMCCNRASHVIQFAFFWLNDLKQLYFVNKGHFSAFIGTQRDA